MGQRVVGSNRPGAAHGSYGRAARLVYVSADEVANPAMTEDPPKSLGSGEGVASSVYLPPFRIDITVRPDVPHLVSRNRLAVAVRAALMAAGAPGPASIGVVLSADDELAQLNSVHMGSSGATDVLSFPFFLPEAFPAHEGGAPLRYDPPVMAALKRAFALPPGLRAHLGDIIVSEERAIVQASDGRGGQTGNVRWTATEELLLLAVHGALHVCGWDHAEPAEEAAMRALEQRILASLIPPDRRDRLDRRGGRAHLDDGRGGEHAAELG